MALVFPKVRGRQAPLCPDNATTPSGGPPRQQAPKHKPTSGCARTIPRAQHAFQLTSGLSTYTQQHHNTRDLHSQHHGATFDKGFTRDDWCSDLLEGSPHLQFNALSEEITNAVLQLGKQGNRDVRRRQPDIQLHISGCTVSHCHS